MRRVQLRGGARWEATRGVRASGECGAMSGPRRRKFVGPIVSRVTWHGGRGRQRSRWALILALGAHVAVIGMTVEVGEPVRDVLLYRLDAGQALTVEALGARRRGGAAAHHQDGIVAVRRAIDLPRDDPG